MPSEKVFGLRDFDPEVLIYRMFPFAVMELARKYFRLEVEGIENIPRRGPAVIAPNHSGFSGFDAMLLSHEIFRLTGRVPRILTHKFWFLTPATKVPAEKVGFIEASMANGLAQLKKNNLVILFPEGESGNFKPTAKRYHLQHFKSGFMRMAIKRQCAVVPTLILGAEESSINLGQLKLDKLWPGLVVPIPLNLVPLPAKWKIIFLKPIKYPYAADAGDDRELLDELSSDLREQMQKAISEEVAKRPGVFFD